MNLIQDIVTEPLAPNHANSPESPLAGWLCIQQSLAEKTDLALLTLAADKEIIGQIENDNSICKRFWNSAEYGGHCDEDCGKAYRRAVIANEAIEYRCHAGLQCFANPIFHNGKPLVVLGGRAFTSTGDYAGFLRRYQDCEAVQEGDCLHSVKFMDVREVREAAELIKSTAHFHFQSSSNTLMPFNADAPTAPDLLDAQLEIIRLSDELENKTRSLHQYRDFLQIVAQSLDSETVYAEVLEKFSEIMKAETSSLLVLNEESEELALEAAVGADFEAHAKIRMKVGDGISGSVMASGAPLLVRNTDTDRRVRNLKHGHYKTKSFISYPITLGQKKLGVINLTDRQGGASYESKDLTLVEMMAPQLALIIDRTEWFKKAEQYQQMSLTDALTGLPNRRYLEERLFEEVERSKRHATPLCFMLIDVDHFKKYNDIYGHTNADLVLIKTAAILRRSVRAIDMPARYAGDEFCIILPETEIKSAAFIAERLCREVRQTEFHSDQSELMGRVTLSIGVSSFGLARQTPLAIIETSDRALYQAKTLGRNRVAIFDDGTRD
ncbi:MAG: diguanylate cyclase [Acidobacteria bacterium]|nr:diguanylate cyclase [Acidobacteriota bacterium]